MSSKTQPAFTCSRSTIQSPKVNNKEINVFIANFGQISNCSGVSVADFKQGNAGWEDKTVFKKNILTFTDNNHSTIKNLITDVK